MHSHPKLQRLFCSVARGRASGDEKNVSKPLPPLLFAHAFVHTWSTSNVAHSHLIALSLSVCLSACRRAQIVLSAAHLERTHPPTMANKFYPAGIPSPGNHFAFLSSSPESREWASKGVPPPIPGTQPLRLLSPERKRRVLTSRQQRVSGARWTDSLSCSGGASAGCWLLLAVAVLAAAGCCPVLGCTCACCSCMLPRSCAATPSLPSPYCTTIAAPFAAQERRPASDWTFLVSGPLGGGQRRVVQRPWPEYVPESSAAVSNLNPCTEPRLEAAS